MNDLVKKWRLEAGITQVELADKLFMTPQGVSLIENGKRTIQYPLLQKIAKIFKKELIFYIQDEPVVKELTEEIFQKEMIPSFQTPGVVPADEEDLRNIISIEGKSYFTKANGILLNEALFGALHHFNEENKPLKNAKGVIFWIEGGTSFTFDDLDYVSDIIAKHTNKNADLVFGSTINVEEKRGFVVKVIASGY